MNTACIQQLDRGSTHFVVKKGKQMVEFYPETTPVSHLRVSCYMYVRLGSSYLSLLPLQIDSRNQFCTLGLGLPQQLAVVASYHCMVHCKKLVVDLTL